MNGAPALVILAAGMGSRYGGLKQFDPIGPHGETLMDYAMFDARRAGFRAAVVVTRREIADELERRARAYMQSGIDATIAYQTLDNLPHGLPVPPNRQKPWGTAQAVLSAAEFVDGSFAVVNADDFYGRAAYLSVAEFFRGTGNDRTQWGVVGYRLRDTMSGAGGVNRAVLTVSAQGRLERIDEVIGIHESTTKLAPDTIVSMNMWALTPAAFDLLDGQFKEFLTTADPVLDEFPLPSAIARVVENRQATVGVLKGGSSWIGVSYPGDRERAAARLRELTDRGEYPERLF